MRKKGLRILLGIVLGLIILPYAIPREFTNPLPQKPYDNSVFFTTSEGIQLHGQWWAAQGEHQGKILMIHGLGASSFSFRNNAPFLAQNGYDVLAVDLPAFGYSDKSLGIDHSQVARSTYLWQWLNTIDENTQDATAWHLVGHSMGASTVLAMANQDPDQVASMHLIGGAVTQEAPKTAWLLNSPLGEWLKVALRYRFISEASIDSLLQSAYQRTPNSDEIQGYLKPLQVQGTLGALIDFVKTSKNVLIEDLIPTDIPLHLYWGAQDTWVSPESIQQIQAAVHVSSVHIFEGEGHCVHETSSTFNTMLLEDLQTH